MWDEAYTEVRIQEAMATLHAQSARGCFPMGHVSNMPDPLQNYWEVWNGLDDSEKTARLMEYNRTRTRVRPQTISEMDEIIFGLTECFLDRRNIVILTARNTLDHQDRPMSWRKLAHRDGRSHTWIKEHVYPEALEKFSAFMRKKTLQNPPENDIEYARL